MADRETKRERMEIRKDIGNRVIERPLPLPEGAAYLLPSACFSCRKSWKVHPDSNAVCPECGGNLAKMGRNFSAPKQTDVEQWKKVELLWLAGFRFSGSKRNHGGAPLPEKLREVEDFLKDHPNHPFRLAEPRSEP